MPLYRAADYLRDQPLGLWALEGRAEVLQIERNAAIAIRRIYLASADALRLKLEREGAATLAGKAFTDIQADLLVESAKLGMALEDRLATDTAKAVAAGAKGSQQALAGLVVGNAAFDQAALVKAFASVNQWATLAQWSRTANGLTLSERIWSTAATFRQDLKALIDMSVASGLGAKDTAVLIDKLAREGGCQLKRTVLADYPNAAERFGKYYDGQLNWEALRLARTEIQVSANEAAVIAGRLTPGYVGSRWMLSDAHPETDICDDYAEADDYGLGPGGYAAGHEMVYAHPNCLCYNVPIMMDREQFVDNLVRWQRGESWPDMDDWYQNVYRSVVSTGEANVPKALERTAPRTRKE